MLWQAYQHTRRKNAEDTPEAVGDKIVDIANPHMNEKLQDFDLGMFICQLLPNILLFIPVGILLDGALPKRNLVSLILIGVGISLCIELVQLFVHVGICDIDDLISNSLGGILGVFPARMLIRLPKHDENSQ